MSFLALDTSTEYLSLALYHKDQVHATSIHVGQKHAEYTINTLREFLDDHELSVAQIKGIAYGKGPGSFTGLRIGCAIAQGIAFANDIPLVGINTLKALALQSTGTHIITAIDARMGEVYLAIYHLQHNNLTTLLTPRLCNPNAPPPIPSSHVETIWAGIGNGFLIQGEALSGHYQPAMLQTEAHVQAQDILMLALPKFSNHQGVSAEEAHLLYLRDKVALTTKERGKG